MTPQSPNEALQPEAPPPPPPKPPSKRSPRLSALSGFLSFLVVAALGALGVAAWSTSRMNEPGPLQADKVVFIPQHTDFDELVDKLQAENVIESPFALKVVLSIERKRAKVKAGEYMFRQHASLQSVVETLVSGKQILHAITIPEGLTSTQVVQRLRDSDVLVGEIREVPKEGTLLPETYKVVRGSTRSDLIIKMQEDDRRAVEKIWARRSPDLPLRSPYELVTLASIVEKETGKADERPRVAGVFANRLQKRMRLQSDPTIVYGLVGGQGTLGHAITRGELDRKTPYNTYQIDGLPPGPIDNPGRAALEAVANPSRTSDLYFVADGTGGHAFAGTVDEHNRNVQRWRQIEREAKDKVDIDKLAPSAVSPSGKGSQRSDLTDEELYGVLPTAIGTISIGRVASFVDPTLNHDIDKIAAAKERGPASTPTKGRGHGRPASRIDPAALAMSIDSMGFSFQDMAPKASDLLDGPITPDAAAGTTQVAAGMTQVTAAPPGRPAAGNPAAMLASKPVKTREARISPLDAAPSDAPVDLFTDPNPIGAQAAPPPMKTPLEHPKIYDASENTPIDPLRNKSYDLNTAKTIPADFEH